MYWIDVSIIAGWVLVSFFVIHLQSKKILQDHENYNHTLEDLRKEIFTEYEKNFFL